MWLELNDELYNLNKIRYITKKDYNNENKIEYMLYFDDLYILYDNESERNNDFLNIKIALKNNKKYLKL